MKKLLIVLIVMGLCLSVIIAKGNSEVKKSDDRVKIAICLSTGGLGDKNFNDMAYDGLKKAEKDYGISFDYYEPQTSSDFEGAFRQFADSKIYELIIGIGADQIDTLKEVAPDYPNQKFSIIDAQLDAPNVKSIATKWEEQTFLCGVYAGLGTLSNMEYANSKNVIGVILGMDFPALRSGVVGFTAGAKYVNPNVEVIEAVVGAFNDPAKGKEIAISMNNRGADFIQHIAGASGLGLFNAAKENNFYAFGVGGNQNHLEPSIIAATSIRNVNEMVFLEVKEIMDGTWKAGVNVNGLKEGAVGYSNDNSLVAIPTEIASAIEEVRKKIVNGELKIASKAADLSSWVQNNQYK